MIYKTCYFACREFMGDRISVFTSLKLTNYHKNLLTPQIVVAPNPYQIKQTNQPQGLVFCSRASFGSELDPLTQLLDINSNETQLLLSQLAHLKNHLALKQLP